MMLASVILSRAATLLQDAGETRWTSAEKLGYLNDAQRAIVLVRPDAKTSRGTIALTAGVDQTIPATGLRLLDVVRNVSGRSITLVSDTQLDDFDPSWPTASQSATIKHYLHDPREPKSFQVYPPATAGTQVQAVWSVCPTDCASTSSSIDLDDIWEPALVAYICHLAYMRDSEDASNVPLASTWRNEFMLLLTGKTQADTAVDPRTNQAAKIAPNQR